MRSTLAPLTDPRPGDVVVKRGLIRQCLETSNTGHAVTYYDQNRDKVVRMIFIGTWKRWCRGAEVLNVAE